MNDITKPISDYWGHIPNIYAEGSQYETRDAFHKGSGGAYWAALELGILDDVCADMKPSTK